MLMKFGVCVPNYGETSSVESIERLAIEAERLGFDSLWTTDHILMPRDSGTPYERIFESITALAFLAPITKKIKLGISSLIIAMRNPVVVVKQLATIDQLSKGRLILATSAGWNEKEFSNLGSNFHDRGKRVDESIRLIRELWDGKDAFESRRLGLNFKDVVFEPRPVQTRLTIWIGGNSSAAMRRAAKLGDAWHPNVIPLDKFRELTSEFRSKFPEAREKPICVRIALNKNSKTSEYTSPQGEKRIILSSNDEENRRIIKGLEDLGVNYAVIAPSHDGRVPIDQQLEGLKMISNTFL